MMLSRILSKTHHFCKLTLTVSHPPLPQCSQISKPQFFLPRYHFSTNGNDNNNNGPKPTSDSWRMVQETDDLEGIFGLDEKAPELEERGSKTGGLGNGNNNNGPKPTSDSWRMAQETDDLKDIFGLNEKAPELEERGSRTGGLGGRESWVVGRTDDSKKDGGLFEFEKTERSAAAAGGGRKGDWLNSIGGTGTGATGFGKLGEGSLFNLGGGGEEGGAGAGNEAEFRPWNVREEEKKVGDIFGFEGISGVTVGDEVTEAEKEMISEAKKLELEKEEQALLEAIKGPERAFGDLIAASGITDDMLYSLIALKNFQGIEGLPPLKQIEDERYEKTTRKSARYELELQKQEEAARARVRKVDEKGRAYGTGKRKCSIARVFIQPGEGKFLVNDKEFDVYFPVLDHRAALLRPFSETKTLGLWDVKCTVKGGGVSGQVDAVQLGISRALQNWEPGLRPPLRAGGFLTRDSRVVERKKPGKAKARKSFQWVKR